MMLDVDLTFTKIKRTFEDSNITLTTLMARLLTFGDINYQRIKGLVDWILI